MGKKIIKTYSVKSEEPLPSQSPVRYDFNKDSVKFLNEIGEAKNIALNHHLDNKPSHYAQIGTHEWLDEWDRGIGMEDKVIDIDREWDRGDGERGNREWERERELREWLNRDNRGNRDWDRDNRDWDRGNRDWDRGNRDERGKNCEDACNNSHRYCTAPCNNNDYYCLNSCDQRAEHCLDSCYSLL